MAITDENNGNGFYMPVAPAYNYGGAYGGNGGFGGDWGWIILLLLAFSGGGAWGGFGGYGMGGFAADGAAIYPWMNQAEITTGGFQNAATNAAIGSLQNSVITGFGDVQNALCGGFAGVNATVNNAQNALAQQMYTNQISDLERSFAAQTANTQGLTALQAQLATCCCENKAATQDVKYTIATEACNTRAANANNTQAILDKLCALELDGYKRENDQLRSQLQAANLQASQTAQTAAIIANNEAQTSALERYLAPNPIPAYVVQNPNGCGCGCN